MLGGLYHDSLTQAPCMFNLGIVINPSTTHCQLLPSGTRIHMWCSNIVFLLLSTVRTGGLLSSKLAELAGTMLPEDCDTTDNGFCCKDQSDTQNNCDQNNNDIATGKVCAVRKSNCSPFIKAYRCELKEHALGSCPSSKLLIRSFPTVLWPI